MTADELRARGYTLRWQKKKRRNCYVALFLHGSRMAHFTGRSEKLLREMVHEHAAAHFVMTRLS